LLKTRKTEENRKPSSTESDIPLSNLSKRKRVDAAVANNIPNDDVCDIGDVVSNDDNRGISDVVPDDDDDDDDDDVRGIGAGAVVAWFLIMLVELVALFPISD